MSALAKLIEVEKQECVSLGVYLDRILTVTAGLCDPSKMSESVGDSMLVLSNKLSDPESSIHEELSNLMDEIDKIQIESIKKKLTNFSGNFHEEVFDTVFFPHIQLNFTFSYTNSSFYISEKLQTEEISHLVSELHYEDFDKSKSFYHDMIDRYFKYRREFIERILDGILADREKELSFKADQEAKLKKLSEKAGIKDA